MRGDRRKLVSTLRTELAFLQAGGYWNVNLPPWRAPLIFQDSPTCLRYGRPHDRRPCSECILTPLVPADQISKQFPCRHFSLNQQGETLDSLHGSNQEEVEWAVAEWLRAKISKLRDADVPVSERARPSGSARAI